MDDKELERRLKEIHDKQHRAAQERRSRRIKRKESDADRWVKEQLEPAFTQLKPALLNTGARRAESHRRDLGLELEITRRNMDKFSYSIQLGNSVLGVEADIRVNDKPVEDTPQKPILHWTQDDVQNDFFKRYESWQIDE
jgi:3'-phosphoadenosine 5'-phosphosulfate sulfotransferase (PAPS reductase)/FAD synthetase